MPTHLSRLARTSPADVCAAKGQREIMNRRAKGSASASALPLYTRGNVIPAQAEVLPPNCSQGQFMNCRYALPHSAAGLEVPF